MKQIQEYLTDLDNQLGEIREHLTDLENQLGEIRERNAQRIQEAKERLGTKYLCHPVNHVKRRDKSRQEGER